MRLSRRISGILSIACAVLALGLPAHPFELFGIKIFEGSAEKPDAVELIDPLPYTVQMAVTGDDRVNAAVRSASLLWQDRERPASGTAGLLAKARGDYAKIIDGLYGIGHYGGQVSISIDGREVTDLPFDLRLSGKPSLLVTVTAGQQFTFSRAEIINQVPNPEPLDPDPGFRAGEPAYASAVADASRAAVEAWRERGHAKADVADIAATADHANGQLAAEVTIKPGAIARYGAISVDGETNLDPEFIRYMADLPSGARFSPADLAKAQRRLSSLGTFRVLRFQEADAIGADGSLPIAIAVEDRKPRRFGIGGTISTLDGAGIEGFWLHRNLFGRAERLRFDASVQGIGRSVDPLDYDYSAGVTLTIPGVFSPDSNFRVGADAKQLVLENYRERSIGALAGFTYAFSEQLTGFADTFWERSRIEDDLGTRDFSLYGLNAGLTWDARDDKLDATSGFFLSGRVKPYIETQFSNQAMQATGEGRVYQAFGKSKRIVAAARLRMGSLIGAPAVETPPSLLFFTGGGGSIRGLEYRSVGVDLPSGDTIGGRSLIEGSLELRGRISDTLGVVGFWDIGTVSPNSIPDFESEFRSGAGVGIRYKTGLGPLRLDLAAPVRREPGDPSFAIYLGLGQAF